MKQPEIDTAREGHDTMQHAFGLDIPQNLTEVCTPARLALLVYDMQVGILRQLPDASDTTARVLEGLEAARAGGYRVLFTRHTSMPLELSGVMQLRTAQPACERALASLAFAGDALITDTAAICGILSTHHPSRHP